MPICGNQKRQIWNLAWLEISFEKNAAIVQTIQFLNKESLDIESGAFWSKSLVYLDWEKEHKKLKPKQTTALWLILAGIPPPAPQEEELHWFYLIHHHFCHSIRQKNVSLFQRFSWDKAHFLLWLKLIALPFPRTPSDYVKDQEVLRHRRNGASQAVQIAVTSCDCCCYVYRCEGTSPHSCTARMLLVDPFSFYICLPHCL